MTDNKLEPPTPPDKNCVTLPDGACVGKGCMHDPQPAKPQPEPSGEQPGFYCQHGKPLHWNQIVGKWYHADGIVECVLQPRAAEHPAPSGARECCAECSAEGCDGTVDYCVCHTGAR